MSYSTFIRQFPTDATTDLEEIVFVCNLRPSCEKVYILVRKAVIYRSKETWVMDLQCDLTHERSNIRYKYIYMWLLFEGSYYFH